jgi:hypothetical protein
MGLATCANPAPPSRFTAALIARCPAPPLKNLRTASRKPNKEKRFMVVTP